MKDEIEVLRARVEELEKEQAEIGGLVPWPMDATLHERVRRMVILYNRAAGNATRRRDGIIAAVDECAKWQAHHAAKGNVEAADYWKLRGTFFQGYVDSAEA